MLEDNDEKLVEEEEAIVKEIPTEEVAEDIPPNTFVEYMYEYISKYSRLDEYFIKSISIENLASIYDLISTYERKLALARTKNPQSVIIQQPVQTTKVPNNQSSDMPVEEVPEQDVIDTHILKVDMQRKMNNLVAEMDTLKISYANMDLKIDKAIQDHLNMYTHIKNNNYIPKK